MGGRARNALLVVTVISAIIVAGIAGRQLAPAGSGPTPGAETRYTEQFFMETCNFTSTGTNRFFILQPTYRLTLRGPDADGQIIEHVITVLNETRTVDGIETRVVEERGLKAGQLVEVAKDYFAICAQTNSVFYFGEDVDFYANGHVVSHNGSWIAGQNGARAGMIMPGVYALGSRYYHEIAPNVAMDRAEIVSLEEQRGTPAGNFAGVLKTKETTPLEPGLLEYKFYAPGIGLIQDEPTKLVQYGYI